MSLEMCHLLLTLKTLLENALRFVTDVCADTTKFLIVN